MGSLPAAVFFQRRLKKLFTGLGVCLGTMPESTTGLLLSMVSLFQMLSAYRGMDEKGKVMNAAFAVSEVKGRGFSMEKHFGAEDSAILGHKEQNFENRVKTEGTQGKNLLTN